jgi:hypothetical protein
LMILVAASRGREAGDGDGEDEKENRKVDSAYESPVT